MDGYNFDYDEVHAYLDRTEGAYVLRERSTNRRLRFEVMEGEEMEEEFDAEEFVQAVVTNAERSEAKYPGIFEADGESCVTIFCTAAKESEEEVCVGVTDDNFFGFDFYKCD